MKQFLCIARLALFVCSWCFAACGDDDGDKSDKTQSPTDTGDSPDAGVDTGQKTATDTVTIELGDDLKSDSTRDAAPSISEADYQSFVGNTNNFGFDLFKQVLSNDANMVFSPVSVAVALAMTYAGAENDTALQMAAAMRNNLDDDVFHAANNQLMLDLEGRNIALGSVTPEDRSLKLSLVNALWAQQGYEILTPFLDTLAIDYDSGVKLVDYIHDLEGSRVTINDWVAQHTEDKITELIPSGSLTSDTRLVLTNALYFYGSWVYPFEERMTEDASFYTLDKQEVSVPMMRQTKSFAYAEGEGYQMVQLPYLGHKVMMTIVLPADGSFSAIRDGMSNEWLMDAAQNLTTDAPVALTMPRFKFAWGTESLMAPLLNLGMVDAFTFGVADFSGINPEFGLFISDVLHQAFIGVDETGTEAAAATAVALGNSDDGEPSPPVVVTLDRPFIFFIRDDSGAILFSGQVINPLL